MSTCRYPCTAEVKSEGFPEFLSRELGAPRRNIQAFARELGSAFDAPFVTLVNSGSSAMLAAALACRQQTKAGEALVAGYTFPTAISALQLAGYSVRIVDTERDGFCMDPDALRAALTARTRVVCFTHFLGFPAPAEALCAIARQHGLLVIQDACETMNVHVNGRPTHKLGDYTTLSFYHPHHLSSYGGGAVLCHQQDQYHLVESASHWGRECTCHFDAATCKAPPGMNHNFWYVRPGQNLEMSELNACFGRFQLQTFPHQEQRRQENYAILHDALKRVVKRRAGIRIYAASANVSPFVFPITTYEQDVLALAERLRQRGVESRTLMGGVVSRQPAFARLKHDGLANCTRQSDASLFVGCHQTLPAEDVASVAAVLEEELSK